MSEPMTPVVTGNVSLHTQPRSRARGAASNYVNHIVFFVAAPARAWIIR